MIGLLGHDELSHGEAYAESVLLRMKRRPGDCKLYDFLKSEIGNNTVTVFSGTIGKSTVLVSNYLQRLSAIHLPRCTDRSLHK